MNDEPDDKQTGSATQQDNTSVPAQQVNTSAPVQPVSGSVKEAEPVVSNEFITPTTPELELSEEVRGAGVKVVPEYPKLTRVDRRAGIEPSEVPAPSLPPIVKLPMSEEEAENKKKSHKPTDSIFFLAEEIMKFYKKKKKDLLRIGE